MVSFRYGKSMMLRSDGYYTNNFREFWTERIREVGKTPLVISGLGFDPRSMQSVKILYENRIKAKVLPVDFSVSSSVDKHEAINKSAINNLNLLKSFDISYDPLKVDMFDEMNRSVGGRQIIQKVYIVREFLNGVNDIIIDISGFPRVLFAPLISFLIDRQKDLNFGNLHVASLPEQSLDKEIMSEQILEPNFLYGFYRPSPEDKFVWIPIIGKNDPERLRNIHNKIEKNCIEICPIFSFRANNPRQIDDLIVTLRKVLFDDIRTFKNNIMYIGHISPFAVYREIIQLSDYYTRLLKELPGPGKVKALITPMDDKTSSVGAIMAAVEKELPVMYADTISYTVRDTNILLNPIEIEPMEIWIAGEAYEI